VKSRGKQRTDSTHILAAIRVLNRLELVHETMRAALESLATVVPDWLSREAPEAWYKRYERRLFSYYAPKTEKARDDLARIIATDGFSLLTKIDSASGMQWLREIPAIQTLRKVWEQQFTQPPDPPRFLEHVEQEPSAERIASPHDKDARFSIKKGVEWTGYKVHFTETCDEDLPRIIVNVETTPATKPDWGMLRPIHESLKRKDMLPSDHMADTGYVSIDSLMSSKQAYGVRVIGPPLEDSSWQAREGGFDKTYFDIDWEARRATCPAGKINKRWTDHKDGSTEVSFNPYDCYRCKYREICVRGLTPAGHPKARHLSLRPRAEHEALQTARQYFMNDDTKALYMQRAGVEGTISEGVRECGMRTARYIGLEKVSLQHVFTALAINFTKLGEWFLGTPLAKTRKSHLEQLSAA
jgi:transposase